MDNFLATFIGGAIVVVLIVGALLVASFVFNAFMLYKFNTTCGNPYPWLAWLPVGAISQMSFVQSCAQVSAFQLESNIVMIAGLCSLVSLSGSIPYIGTILTYASYLIILAFYVFSCMSISNVCKELDTSATPLVLMYLLIPFFGPGIVYNKLRKKLEDVYG